MKTVTLLFLLTALCFTALAQTVNDPTPTSTPVVASTDNADFRYLFGSGSGFKPYQTPIKSGAYGFVEGGMQPLSGVYTFARVHLLSSYAVLVLDACKSIYRNPSSLLMFCGGGGMGMDANTIGATYDTGGKWFFSPGAMRKADAWIGIEVGVQKSSVPAPVQNGTTISPVQPDFRIGLHKFFR